MKRAPLADCAAVIRLPKWSSLAKALRAAIGDAVPRMFVALLGIAVALMPSTTPAAIVTVEATDFPIGGPTNTTVNGFRFSPNCHFDVATLEGGWPSDIGKAFVGIDGSGCGMPESTNPNYLGPDFGVVALYIDAGGRPFSLLELTFFNFLERLVSSKGGEFSGHANFDPDLGDANTDIWTQPFSGSDWTGVTWIAWLYPSN